MSYWKTVCVLTLTALAATLAAGQKSQAAKQKGGQSQVVQITLPNYSGDVLPGPNVEIYKKNCLLCHSSRYVAMQPNFSRTVWEKEVKKMIDAYGATIPEADQAQIVDYLVAVRGVPENKPAEAPAATK